ncbi:MAG TPA: hypothetical protein VI356_01570 [Myxococcales bacterium]
MSRAVALALLLACSGRPQVPAADPGVHLLPEEAWLYARLPGGRWSEEIEDENVIAMPATDELKLQLTDPLAEFRVRLVDAAGEAVPHRAATELHAPTGQQIHTLSFAQPLLPGAYRIVIDAPPGGVLRDARGRRMRGQRFRLLVHPAGPGD